jgi:hypothetical protein
MRSPLRLLRALIGLVFALAVLLLGSLASSRGISAEPAAKAPPDTSAKIAAKAASPLDADFEFEPDEEEPVAPRPHRPASPQPEPTDSTPSKIRRYAERLIRQYDRNGDGVLDAAEWQQMHGDSQPFDTDKDGQITVEELARRIADYGRTRRVRLAIPPIGTADEAKAAAKADGKTEAKTPAKAGAPS